MKKFKIWLRNKLISFLGIDVLNSTINQEIVRVDSIQERVTVLEMQSTSSIATLSQAIDQKVNKDDVINAINLSDEDTLKIDKKVDLTNLTADKIHLDGAIHVSNGSGDATKEG